MVTWKLVGWLRAALMSILLALGPLAAPAGGRDAAPRPTSELNIDVDGDGRADRVRLMRHDDGFWLDVALAGVSPDVFTPCSTTRVASAAAATSMSALDVDGDGRMDVLVRDAVGHTTVWVSDGLAFEPVAPASPPLSAAMGTE